MRGRRCSWAPTHHSSSWSLDSRCIARLGSSRRRASRRSRSTNQDGRFGTVAVGNRADLVLLEANPLESVGNLTKRAGVMVKGRWVSAAEIDKGLAELAMRFAQ